MSRLIVFMMLLSFFMVSEAIAEQKQDDVKVFPKTGFFKSMQKEVGNMDPNWEWDDKERAPASVETPAPATEDEKKAVTEASTPGNEEKSVEKKETTPETPKAEQTVKTPEETGDKKIE